MQPDGHSDGQLEVKLNLMVEMMGFYTLYSPGFHDQPKERESQDKTRGIVSTDGQIDGHESNGNSPSFKP